jgi:uncharacterized protein YbjT (DUF2867 family)
VRGLVRRGSEGKLTQGCGIVLGNPLDRATYEREIKPADTFVHLVGVASPSPRKAKQFLEIDLASATAAIDAAARARVRHFVYVSVAQPAPVMHAYQAARAQAELHLAEAQLHATILRPWYVLGPGRTWPKALLPAYALAERIPGWRSTALRLGLVTIEQMVAALVQSIEDPPYGTQFLTVPDIREARMAPL